MLSTNPYTEISTWIPPEFMQIWVAIMIGFVLLGTIFDIVHKKSARFFRQNMAKSRDNATEKVSGGQLLAIAAKTALVDVAVSGEFCNQKRRIAHLLTMYGFLAFAISTAVMVYVYPTAAKQTPVMWPWLWSVGALMVCIGGYWFWFFIRADVSAEGNSPFRFMRADLFILSLLTSATFALVWAYLQFHGYAWARTVFVIHMTATTVLFASVPWSKFAHMFFKPAAAFEKRLSEANGSRSNLPAPVDKPATLGGARQSSSHY